MPLQYVTSLRKHELQRKGRIEQPLAPIAAELIDPHCCDSLGSVGKGNSPVLGLCRFHLAAGFNPDQALDVYRAGTPALRVKGPRAHARQRVKEPDHAACNPLSFAPKHAVGRRRRSSSTELQLLLPFVASADVFQESAHSRTAASSPTSTVTGAV